MSRDHRKLDVFHLADEMVLDVYKVTKVFPKHEWYGLRSQIRRAATSVPLNIVEGCGRRSERELIQSLNIAFASLRELGYALDLSVRLGMIPAEPLEGVKVQIDQVASKLTGLIRALNGEPR